MKAVWTPIAVLARMLAALVLTTGLAMAEAPRVNLGYEHGLAMAGYDVMSYWNGGDPKKGDRGISAQYNGATWVFVSDAHRQEFLSDPDRYAPQYGGYCAYAASLDAVADVDPFAWRIWNDKLYLNYSTAVRQRWAGDIGGNVARADGFWPDLLQND